MHESGVMKLWFVIVLQVYMHHLYGHYFFLPGIPFKQLGKWHLPQEEMKKLITIIK